MCAPLTYSTRRDRFADVLKAAARAILSQGEAGHSKCNHPAHNTDGSKKSELHLPHGEVLTAILFRLEADASLALKLSGTVGLVGDLAEGS